jgi:hypothetical protein
MKFLLIVALTLAGCASQPASTTAVVSDPKLDSYFERYCDYTGGMGIGFVASHTYQFEFRQRLKTTQDKELKRLFVLQHLYGETDLMIADFENGIVKTGKSESRQMQAEERAAARVSIIEHVDDLSHFDPTDPQREIARLRERLERAGN